MTKKCISVHNNNTPLATPTQIKTVYRYGAEHRKNRVAVVGLRFSCLDRLFFGEISCCCCRSYKKRRRPQLPPIFFQAKGQMPPVVGGEQEIWNCTGAALQLFSQENRSFF